MGKHTPGPWTVGYAALTVESEAMKVCDIRGWGYLTGKGSGALGLPEDAAKAVQKANARLIAAAPEMLEELRDICPEDCEAELAGADAEDCRHCRILALIARIEGRTP